MCNIHKSAIIGDDVKLGKNVTIMAYAYLEGNLIVEDGTKIYPHACIGTLAEHVDVVEASGLPIIIGKNVTIRDQVAINSPIDTETVIGDGSHIFSKSHVSHDSKLGKNVILTPGVKIGGYVGVQDGAYLGMSSSVHPYTQVGAHAIAGLGSSVKKNIPPFSSGFGNPFRWNKINNIGLQRRSEINSSEWKAIEQILQHPFHTKKELRAILDRYEDTINLTAPTVWKMFNLFYDAMITDSISKYSGPTIGKGKDLLYDVEVANP